MRSIRRHPFVIAGTTALVVLAAAGPGPGRAGGVADGDPDLIQDLARRRRVRHGHRLEHGPTGLVEPPQRHPRRIARVRAVRHRQRPVLRRDPAARWVLHRRGGLSGTGSDGRPQRRTDHRQRQAAQGVRDADHRGRGDLRRRVRRLVADRPATAGRCRSSARRSRSAIGATGTRSWRRPSTTPRSKLWSANASTSATAGWPAIPRRVRRARPRSAASSAEAAVARGTGRRRERSLEALDPMFDEGLEVRQLARRLARAQESRLDDASDRAQPTWPAGLRLDGQPCCRSFGHEVGRQGEPQAEERVGARHMAMGRIGRDHGRSGRQPPAPDRVGGPDLVAPAGVSDRGEPVAPAPERRRR